MLTSQTSVFKPIKGSYSSSLFIVMEKLKECKEKVVDPRTGIYRHMCMWISLKVHWWCEYSSSAWTALSSETIISLLLLLLLDYIIFTRLS